MKVVVDNVTYNIDMETKIHDSCNILKDIEILNQTIKERDVTEDFILETLKGIRNLYDMKFENLFDDFKYHIKYLAQNHLSRQGDLEAQIMTCWSLTNELNVLVETMENRETSVDEKANVLLGLQALGAMKFEKLWEEYRIHMNLN